MFKDGKIIVRTNPYGENDTDRWEFSDSLNPVPGANELYFSDTHPFVEQKFRGVSRKVGCG